MECSAGFPGRTSAVNAFFRRFLNSDSGATAVLFGLFSMVMLLSSGIAVDFSRATSAKSQLQSNLDASTLAAAHGKSTPERDLIFRTHFDDAVGTPQGFHVVSRQIAASGDTLSATTSADVDTVVMKMFNQPTLRVEVESAVNVAAPEDVEIALVLDVSSSMIEEGRFAPMQEAANRFVSMISDPANGIPDWKISVVPFSSRVNLSLSNSSFFRSFGSSPAIPDRWVNPSNYYNSSYTRMNWISGGDYAMVRADRKNQYWMGCAEPRVDVAIVEGTSVANSLTDATPSSTLFVPMDSNSQSSTSFCPPPIVPLNANTASLTSAINALTSQGSTRLDVGMLAGWYTLSPRWRGQWSTGASTNAYGSGKKIAVFMTDGRMNTQDDASSSKFDWVCSVAQDCDDYANNRLIDICNNMRNAGITIFTVAYDPDADRSFIRQCASSDRHFFEATSSPGNDYIRQVYERIAKEIVQVTPRLVR